MSASVLIPVSEYLARTYEPDREYVDGLLVERNVGEHDHSILQTEIGASLRALQASYNIRVFTEQRIRVVDSPQQTRFRIPDICVMQRPYTRGPVLVEPPLLIVEILSPDDTVDAMADRIEDYIVFGVKFIWVVDPRRRTVSIVSREGVRPVADRRPAFTADGKTAILDFEEIFRQLD